MPNTEGYFSTTEVAKALGVSRITIFRYIKAGKLKATKQGRNYAISASAWYSFQYEYLMTDEDREIIKKAVFEMFDEIQEGLLQQTLRGHELDKFDTASED